MDGHDAARFWPWMTEGSGGFTSATKTGRKGATVSEKKQREGQEPRSQLTWLGNSKRWLMCLPTTGAEHPRSWFFTQSCVLVHGEVTEHMGEVRWRYVSKAAPWFLSHHRCGTSTDFSTGAR